MTILMWLRLVKKRKEEKRVIPQPAAATTAHNL